MYVYAYIHIYIYVYVGGSMATEPAPCFPGLATANDAKHRFGTSLVILTVYCMLLLEPNIYLCLAITRQSTAYKYLIERQTFGTGLRPTARPHEARALLRRPASACEAFLRDVVSRQRVYERTKTKARGGVCGKMVSELNWPDKPKTSLGFGELVQGSNGQDTPRATPDARPIPARYKFVYMYI